MAYRAYFLVNFSEGFEAKNLDEEIQKLEEGLEVDFVDPVVGEYDMVIMIETGDTIEAAAREIEKLEWVEDLKILRTIDAVFKHRLSKREGVE